MSKRTSDIDLGRLLVVPLAIGALVLNLIALRRVLNSSIDPAVAVRALGIVLTLAFYALIAFAYLRRAPATATSRSVPAAIAAVVATVLPFAFPLLLRGDAPTVIGVLADSLLLSGLAWSVWSIHTLDRSLSVLAQARTLAASGPYRVVRHPLYLGEVVAALGIALRGARMPVLFAWIAFIALQAYRARTEERLLSASLPEYAAYRARTALLLPPLL